MTNVRFSRRANDNKKMSWPLSDCYFITSLYGMRTRATGQCKLHTGIDIMAQPCKVNPVVATRGGKVVERYTDDFYGNVIVIDHGNGISTLYAHASNINVNVGDFVKEKQEIAFIDSEEYKPKNCLHFEISVNGELKDPLQYLEKIS